ncbi:MAG: Gfo/Idh/MocA family oxidoreductase [Candidatus Pacebacteria bacterium]|nr:Gfo/Idh/MocA family oxidoreductase [Candidatus Paceibacterota bacterium]
MKLAMIGCRGHNAYVFDGLKKHTDVNLAAVSSGTDEDDVSPLTEQAVQLGYDPTVYQNYREMLDAEAPDIVSVAGPFHQVADMTTEALNRGISVLAEKPVAATLDQLAQLKNAYQKNRAELVTMMGLRYDPAFYTAHSLVQNGAIGTPRLLDARKSYKLGTRPEFYKHRETSTGIIPWVGSHAIDWIYWFTQQPFTSVRASHSARFNRDHGDLEVSAMCHFTLQNDVSAAASLDFLRPQNAVTHGDDRIRVAGTDGVIEVRHGNVYLINADHSGQIPLEIDCPRHIFSDFLSLTQGSRDTLLTTKDVFTVTEACLLARQAADEDRVIRFEEQEPTA